MSIIKTDFITSWHFVKIFNIFLRQHSRQIDTLLHLVHKLFVGSISHTWLTGLMLGIVIVVNIDSSSFLHDYEIVVTNKCCFRFGDNCAHEKECKKMYLFYFQ